MALKMKPFLCDCHSEGPPEESLPPQEIDTLHALLDEFQAAAAQLLEWYDGDRAIITHKGYTCPTARGAHGMTMIRTAMINLDRHKNKLPPLESKLPPPRAGAKAGHNAPNE
jgi:hypothetical protein